MNNIQTQFKLKLWIFSLPTCTWSPFIYIKYFLTFPRLIFQGLFILIFQGLFILIFQGLFILIFQGLFILIFQGLFILIFQGTRCILVEGTPLSLEDGEEGGGTPPTPCLALDILLRVIQEKCWILWRLIHPFSGISITDSLLKIFRFKGLYT